MSSLRTHRFFHHSIPGHDKKRLVTSFCLVGEGWIALLVPEKEGRLCHRVVTKFSSSATAIAGSQEITAGSSLCCPTTRSLGPEIPPRRQSASKVKGEEKPRSALDPSTVERGQERSLWEPARLLYDVKSSWSAAAGGLLHHQHNRAASSPQQLGGSCLLRRLFRVGAFRPSSRHQPPGCSCSSPCCC